jgi:DNA polymerase-3 subunit gamma/tau
VKFILATTEPHRLPPTILSRCQRYDFRRIQLREIVQRLSLIAKEEGLDLTEGALVLLAREADGSMRDAQSLLEQVLAMAQSAGQRIDESLIQEVLGLAGRAVLYEISAAVLAGDGKRCVDLIADVVDSGRDVNRLSRDLVEHFRNLLVARLTRSDGAAARRPSGGSAAQLLDLPDQEIADLIEQTRAVSIETLLDYLDFMAAGDEAIGRSPTPRFALESALIRLAALPQSLPVAQLIERLERLQGNSRAPREPGARPLKARTEAPPHISEPIETTGYGSGATARDDESGDDARSGAQAAPGSSSARSWSDFVLAVSRAKKFLGSHLEHVQPLELPPGRLRIGVSERHRLAFLLDSDNLASLREAANQYFGQEVNVQIVNQIADAIDGREAAPPQAEARSTMVNEALRIFGGSVRTVRRE